MSYGRRLDWPGSLHHVMSRGVNGMDVFRTDDQKRQFLSLLDRYFPSSGIKVHAWALMDNHFHLLTETGNVSLSSAMHRLLTTYSIWFNLQEKRSGRVFQGRYRSILVDRQKYYLALAVYINTNPLRAGLVPSEAALEAYPWSGHSFSFGSRNGHPWEDGENSSDDYRKHFQRQFSAFALNKGKDVSAAFLEAGKSLLYGAGLAENKHPSASELDQLWNAGNRIMGDKVFALEVARSQTDKRYQTIRQRERQHELAEYALKKVESIFNVSSTLIRGRSRVEPAYRARAILVQYLVLFCGFNFSDVGRFLCRSRQSIAYSFNKHSHNELIKLLLSN